MNNINIPYVKPSPDEVAKELNMMMMNPNQYVGNIRFKDAYILYLARIIHDMSNKQTNSIPIPAVPSPPVVPVSSSKKITKEQLATILKANKEMMKTIEDLTKTVNMLNTQVQDKNILLGSNPDVASTSDKQKIIIKQLLQKGLKLGLESQNMLIPQLPKSIPIMPASAAASAAGGGSVVTNSMLSNDNKINYFLKRS